jgi:hypothetical protein
MLKEIETSSPFSRNGALLNEERRDDCPNCK